MINPSNTKSAGGYIVRNFLGGQLLSTGTWLKTDLAAESFLVGKKLEKLEYEIECVGGGGCGNTINPASAGLAGDVKRISLTYDELPDSAAVVRGSGSTTSSSVGGYSSFGDLCIALGGGTGSRAGAWYPNDEAKDGPGNGGSEYTVTTLHPGKLNTDGGDGNASFPTMSTAGGVTGGPADTTGDLGGRDGENTADPRMYGGGGADLGRGGFPGGGGGCNNGRGGNGSVRIRVWEHKSV